LKLLSKTEGIGHITEFTGSIPHSEVPEVLARMDVFVALSREESFGVAVVEAGAMGIPVVVSDRGGLPEVVLDRKTGIVVPSDNPEAAAEAILELIENASLRSQLGQAARAHVAEHYSESHCNAVMFALYKAVINEGQ
jgi:glycosyltransferase involved in cell wall biosynthesis